MTVQELLNKTLPRLKGPTVDGMDIYQAVNSISDLLFTVLIGRKSDLAKATGEVVVAAGSSTGDLPDAFRGTTEHPWVEDQGQLSPMTETYRSEYTGQTGQIPEFYDLRGTALLIYPYPASTDDEVTVQVPYWQYPDAVDALDDDVPYSGALDPIYTDLTPAYLTGAANDADAMRLAVAMKLDMLLMRRMGGRRRVNSVFY